MFALHVFDSAGEAGPVPDRPPLSALDGVEVGRAPALAVAGYQLAHLSSAPPETAEKWRAGGKRLGERNPFPPDRQAFPFRPLELYGIALGAADSAERAWLADVLGRLKGVSVTGPWAKVIGRLAATHLGGKWAEDRPTPAACQTTEELAALRWITSAAEKAEPKGFDARPVNEAILKTAAVTRVEPTDVAHAAVLYHALRRAAHERLESDLAGTWLVSRPTRDALELVTVLCRRLRHFARQIQVRREGRNTIQFTDEYAVQDAVHAPLRLHFTDVRAEEWTPN